MRTHTGGIPSIIGSGTVTAIGTGVVNGDRGANQKEPEYQGIGRSGLRHSRRSDEVVETEDCRGTEGPS